MSALLSVMALAGNQWQTQGFNSGALNKGTFYRQMGTVNRTKKSNETPRDWQWWETVPAWVWWVRGGVKGLRAGDSSENYERSCLTWCYQNNSNLRMSCPKFPVHPNFLLFPLSDLLLVPPTEAQLGKWRATVTPGESSPKGTLRRM